MKKKLVSLLFAAAASLTVLPPAYAQAEPAAIEVAAVTAAKINLNQADAETLVRELKGIGPAKAQAIIDYREQQGAFVSVDELLEVKGIGVATLERLRGQLAVE